MRIKSMCVLTGTLMLLVSSPAWAGEGITPTSNAAAIDTIWTLLAAFLVFFMHAGFTMVEIGFTRAKNAINIIMKNILTVSIGAVTFFIVGFGIMFGESAGGLVGVPIEAFWIFQAVFAATAATIVSGAVAERIKFSAYLLFTIVITAIIYPLVGHWIWSDGWLARMGFVDFAGSTVVHSTGGWAALVVAYYLGPRLGKYSADGRIHPIHGHSMPLGAIGVLILWFGWFGFNAGSTVSGTDVAIANIAVVTLLGGAAGVLSVTGFTWWKYGKPEPSMVLNGALAGLVGITAGANSISPAGGIVIGACAGIIMVIAVETFDKILKIDDPVGAISVHGVTGAFGTMAVGLFAVDGGLFYGGGTAMLVTQLTGIVAVFAFVTFTSTVTIKIIKRVVGLRVSGTEEEGGLDLGEHGMEAYVSLESNPSTMVKTQGVVQ